MSRKVREQLRAELEEEIRAGQNATDALDQAVVDHLGINRTDGRCLDIIDRREPISAGELASAAGLTTGAVTAVLDRLEEAGYVRRVRDAEDRRRVLVELTEQARQAVVELYGPLAEHGHRLLERYSDDELRLVLEFMRAGRELQERTLAHVRERLARSRAPARRAGADGRRAPRRPNSPPRRD